MWMRTVNLQISDLRKQKDAVMCLSTFQTDEDDMPYYASLFKQAMETDISKQIVTEQRKA